MMDDKHLELEPLREELEALIKLSKLYENSIKEQITRKTVALDRLKESHSEAMDDTEDLLETYQTFFNVEFKDKVK